MWLSIVCALIDNDICHHMYSHCGENVVDSLGQVRLVSPQHFDHCEDRYH